MPRQTSIRNQEVIRCGWVGTKPHFIPYHDEEWGVPVHDDIRHFEMLILEGAQAGLSWSTILLRREGYRKAFAGFDPLKVANFDAKQQAALLQDPGIIRNRLKIASAITNARAFLKMQDKYGSFDAYMWKFIGGAPRINHWKDMSQVPATTPESDALSKDLKQRGFRFVGSTVIYAHMQAAGLVNDHTLDCFRHPSNIASPPPSRVAAKRRVNRIHPLKIKRVFDPPSPEDGIRILIDRLWPRGLSKATAKVDRWLKDLAPSTALRKWFQHDPARWQEFQKRYTRELKQQPEGIKEVLALRQKESVTLLYGASNPQWNHAVALQKYLATYDDSDPNLS